MTSHAVVRVAVRTSAERRRARRRPFVRLWHLVQQGRAAPSSASSDDDDAHRDDQGGSGARASPRRALTSLMACPVMDVLSCVLAFAVE